MGKSLDVQEVLDSMREDGQQLEKLVNDLKQEEESSVITGTNPAMATALSSGRNCRFHRLSD